MRLGSVSAPGVWHQGLAVIRCPNPVRFGTQQLPQRQVFSRKCGRRRLQEGIKVGLTTCLRDHPGRAIDVRWRRTSEESNEITAWGRCCFVFLISEGKSRKAFRKFRGAPENRIWHTIYDEMLAV